MGREVGLVAAQKKKKLRVKRSKEWRKLSSPSCILMTSPEAAPCHRCHEVCHEPALPQRTTIAATRQESPPEICVAF